MVFGFNVLKRVYSKGIKKVSPDLLSHLLHPKLSNSPVLSNSSCDKIAWGGYFVSVCCEFGVSIACNPCWPCRVPAPPTNSHTPTPLQFQLTVRQPVLHFPMCHAGYRGVTLDFGSISVASHVQRHSSFRRKGPTQACVWVATLPGTSRPHDGGGGVQVHRHTGTQVSRNFGPGIPQPGGGAARGSLGPWERHTRVVFGGMGIAADRLRGPPDGLLQNMAGAVLCGSSGLGRFLCQV